MTRNPSANSLPLLSLLPLLALACATSSSFRVQADVRTLQAGSRDAAGITAVSGADVALECPDASANRSLGKTDESGSLRAQGDGAIPLVCKVAITQPGYKPVALAVADLCTERSMGACAQLSVRAMLYPDAR